MIKMKIYKIKKNSYIRCIKSEKEIKGKHFFLNF